MRDDWVAWAKKILANDAVVYGPVLGEGNLHVLAQAVKLGEEVGELHAEILARVGFIRAAKAAAHSDASLSEEFADVMISLLLLAELTGVDLKSAVSSKIRERPDGR